VEDNEMNTKKLALTMSSSEQAIKGQLLRDAHSRGGYSTVCIVEAIWAAHLKDAIYEAQHFLSLAQHFSSGRLEDAATRAIYYGQGTARTVRKILHSGSDVFPLDTKMDIWGNCLDDLFF
jgi:hypothetical protein